MTQDSSGSGRRPILPGPRTPSSEFALIPKRALVELFEVVLDADEQIMKLTNSRIEIAAARRRFEEIVQQHVPGLVLEVMLKRREEEKTPARTPEALAKDVEQTKKP